MKGCALQVDTIVVLMLDGTLVYVEDVQKTFAAVVALPEQPPERDAESRVLIPGRVGPKKISPYSQPSDVIDAMDLSQRNKDFVCTFKTLRETHGPNFIDATPEEAARMSVRKAGPTHAPRMKLDPADKQARRDARRAAKKKCATCGEKPAAHGSGTDHPFTAKAGRVAREKTPGRVGKSSKYKVISPDLTAAQAASDKFKSGNRFFRVFAALQSLPESTGSFEDIVSAVERDGARAMTDAVKVARRALKQLASCGNVERL